MFVIKSGTYVHQDVQLVEHSACLSREPKDFFGHALNMIQWESPELWFEMYLTTYFGLRSRSAYESAIW